MLDHPPQTSGRYRGEATVPLPVSDMVCGMAPEEAAAVLPRIFNLCRAAQKVGVRMALGLPVGAQDRLELHREILREHLFAFSLKYRRHFGMAPETLPQHWQTNPTAVRDLFFGPSGAAPATHSEFTRFLERGHGVAPVLNRIRDCFGPLEACSAVLPAINPLNAFSVTALENSVAGRQAHHPVMRATEQEYGRGPFWRAVARLYDAEACLKDALPPPSAPDNGLAVVPAARGTYAVSATVENDRVVEFRRITPTDHLVARGGILDQTLASLPERKSGMAPLILDILDPCTPVRLKEVRDA